MTFPPRLLPALLLALAGCSIAASPSELAPKSDAECAAAGKKACGYKCVGLDDPATGCGLQGCSPCAALGAHTVAACTELHECGYLCATGWGDCNGDPLLDGCEAPTDSDPANCGWCTHGCVGGCTGGFCDPEVLDTPWGEPRGIVSSGQYVYWADTGASGEVLRFDTATDFRAAVAVVTGLEARTSEPLALGRLAIDEATGTMYASGSESGGRKLTVFQFPATGGAAAPLAVAIANGAGADTATMPGLAVAAGMPFFSYSTDDLYAPDIPLWWTKPGPLPTSGAVLTGSKTTGILGVTGVGQYAFYGHPGTLAFADAKELPYPCTTFTTCRTENTLFTGLTSWPARVALFPPDPAATPSHVFWADETNGSVWRVPWNGTWADATVVWPATGTPTWMEIASDRSGVVWCDWYARRIGAWRASDGAVFDVALPEKVGWPWAVAINGPYVYWTDATAGSWAVKRAVK